VALCHQRGCKSLSYSALKRKRALARIRALIFPRKMDSHPFSVSFLSFNGHSNKSNPAGNSSRIASNIGPNQAQVYFLFAMDPNQAL